MTDKIRVLLVDDHEVVRHGFKYFIDVIKDLELVGEASNGQEAVELVRQLRPDIVLMDMVMPKMTGVEATKAIKAAYPETKVIALTSFTDDENLVHAALAAGASGYFFKNVGVDELSNAVHRIYKGEIALTPEATQLLVKATITPQQPEIEFTEREKDIIRLMIEGLNNREIGEKLYISRATAKFHVSSILSKLSVSSRTEAVAVIVQNHLIET
jgi:two-component system, NarL family, response regulator LiaR